MGAEELGAVWGVWIKNILLVALGAYLIWRAFRK